jgi:DNA-binding transcriptional LysR family regulator
MNDRQLRYALSVWREQSFSRAAEKLNVSQPSISDQVRMLEEELGFQIFNRTGRGVEATHKGERFLTEASEAVERLNDLSETARELRGGAPISIKIGVASSLARTVVPQVMAALMPLTNGARIETITAPTRRILRFVAEERLDVGIAIEAAGDALQPFVRAEVFGRVKVMLAVPPGHRLARRNAAVELAEIANEPYIAHEPDVGYGPRIRALLVERGVRSNVCAVADDTETINLMVAAGVGLSLLPESAVAPQTKALPLKPPIELSMMLVRHERPASAATARLIDALSKTLTAS